MKISWNYLNRYINLKEINILKITEKLTLAGLEVENIIYDDEIIDTIFDVSVTANRQDICGFVDIATELSAILEEPLKICPQHSSLDLNENIYFIDHFSTHNENKHIQLYLKKLNSLVSNTFLDTISFINLQWGQDITAYRITLKNENNLQNIFSQLQSNINRIKNLKSCLQKLNTENINQHKHIQEIILINHKKYSFYSSCAYKNIFQILRINKDQVYLIQKPYIKKSSIKIKPPEILCNLDIIKKRLGPTNLNPGSSLSNKTITKILNNLKFKVQQKDNYLRIEIPQTRVNDIHDEIDLSEEVGRIYGFNHFIDKLPYFENSYHTTDSTNIESKIRRILRSMGLHEVISSSLQGTNNKKKSLIINPLNQEFSVLRNNLIENLINLKIENMSQNNEKFEVFEIGNVFNNQSLNKRSKSYLHLTCLMGNSFFNQPTWQNKKHALNWHQVKGQIEELLDKINSRILWSTKKEPISFIDSLTEYIHPTRSIYINYNGKTIGILSQLNYRINYMTNIDTPVYFFEINITQLKKTIKQLNHLEYHYLKYPNYPKVTRDYSIKVKSTFSVGTIYHTLCNIKNWQNYMIESIEIVNEYYDKKQDRTVCFRINYRPLNRTLTNIEVQAIDNSLKKRINDLIKSKT